MELIEAFKQFPVLCGCPEGKREGHVIGLIFNDEINNPESPFARNDADKADPYNRLTQAISWQDRATDKKKAAYCVQLMYYATLLHYQAEHGENYSDELTKLEVNLCDQEAEYADVSAIASVATVTATAASMWGG